MTGASLSRMNGEPTALSQTPLQDGVHRLQPEDGAQILHVWEHSVRSTHTFLAESDIQFLKPLILPALFGMVHLFGVRDQTGNVVAFVGVADGKMEALFVHPSWHRRGIGRRLAAYATDELGATSVDVNEQNEQAVGFYLRLGFKVVGRSELDSTGKPFPLLHMRLDGSEVRGQKSEIRDQKSGVRSQRSDVRGQGSEVRGQTSEVRSQKSKKT
jgi:putative acetyltransferase